MSSNYPSSYDYRAAFQYMHESLTDQFLKEGTVKSNSLGPQVFSGNFAYAYEVTSRYRVKYAVRCFRYFSKDREERYIGISKFLKQLRSYYFVDFEYQPEGIIIHGIKYPIVKMAWVDGDLLGQFIADNYSNRRRLKNLITSLIALARFIEQHNFAHGDIQPGNIIVNNDGKDLRLIDYDGMYVKDIHELGNCECGTPNFQHPQRGNAWSAKLDRFAFISLYVALNALAERYSLWEELSCDTESILFVSADYEDTKHSKTFTKIKSIENMKEDAQKFQRICDAPFDKIPSLDDFIEGKNVPNYHHTSKLVYFASAIIILMFGTIYFLENNDAANMIYGKISMVKEFFKGKKDEPKVEVKERYDTGLNLHTSRDYADTIKQLDDLHEKLPQDNDITLLAAATYALSGYNDNALAALVEPLAKKNVEDSRLYFALSMLYWRKNDIEQANYFMDLVSEQNMDDKIRNMIVPLRNILRTELNIRSSYMQNEEFDGRGSKKFADAMLLRSADKFMYEYFAEIYSYGFTGFSNEYPLDTSRRSFAEWFNAYTNYNMGKSLKMLIDLHKEYPKNTKLLYHITTNIAALHIEGSEGKCYFRRDKYLKIAKEIRYESSLLGTASAIEFAKKLVELPFSSAQSYYALSLSYYANGEFDIAASIANIAKTKIAADDTDEVKAQIETLLQNINSSIACRLNTITQ